MRWRREIRFETLGRGAPGVSVVRWWVLALVAVVGGVVGLVCVFTIDGAVSAWFETARPSGDVRRELEALQQFGAIGSVLIVAGVIASVDACRLRRMLDYGLAIGLTMLVAKAMKMTIGRARPKLDDARLFLGPTGSVEVEAGAGAIHAWELGADGVAVLQSMPSTHTASAVVLAVFLMSVYPRLMSFGVAFSVLVGTARVVLGAHWVGDVVVGGTLAFAIAMLVIPRCWGVRLVDWVWLRLVDRSARPALGSALGGGGGGSGGGVDRVHRED